MTKNGRAVVSIILGELYNDQIAHNSGQPFGPY